jgi:hypothetical protein
LVWQSVFVQVELAPVHAAPLEHTPAVDTVTLLEVRVMLLASSIAAFWIPVVSETVVGL